MLLSVCLFVFGDASKRLKAKVHYYPSRFFTLMHNSNRSLHNSLVAEPAIQCATFSFISMLMLLVCISPPFFPPFILAMFAYFSSVTPGQMTLVVTYYFSSALYKVVKF